MLPEDSLHSELPSSAFLHRQKLREDLAASDEGDLNACQTVHPGQLQYNDDLSLRSRTIEADNGCLEWKAQKEIHGNIFANRDMPADDRVGAVADQTNGKDH